MDDELLICDIDVSVLTNEENSASCNLCSKFIALQSLCPHTITCFMSFTMQPNSNAAGSLVVSSSMKCWECGMTLPAFRTRKVKHYFR